MATEITDHFMKDGVVYYSSRNFPQSVVEFSRYKQDCRKRALDLAAEDKRNWVKLNEGRNAVMTPEPDIFINSDKYYNWLISIPQ